MRQARENGAEPAVLEVIEAMPEGEYASMADVMKGYGEADDAPPPGAALVEAWPRRQKQGVREDALLFCRLCAICSQAA